MDKDGFEGARRRKSMRSFEPARDIENASTVTAIFGGWPSFHDAEIRSILLKRDPQGPFLECSVHVFQMTSEVDERGYYVNKNHTLVTLRFSGLRLYELKWFNNQNAIDGMEIEPATDGDGQFSVYLPSNSGCEASFNCDRISVSAAEPYTGEQMARDLSIYAPQSVGDADSPGKIDRAGPVE